MDRKDELIKFLSNNSGRYGEWLIKFMEYFKLPNLKEATVLQLEFFIDKHKDELEGGEDLW